MVQPCRLTVTPAGKSACLRNADSCPLDTLELLWGVILGNRATRPRPAAWPPPTSINRTSPPTRTAGNIANAASGICGGLAGHGLNQSRCRQSPVEGIHQRDSAWRQARSSQCRTLCHFPFPVLPRHSAPGGRGTLPRSQRRGQSASEPRRRRPLTFERRRNLPTGKDNNQAESISPHVKPKAGAVRDDG